MTKSKATYRGSVPQVRLWTEIGIVCHADECRFRSGRGTDSPIGLLVDIEPYDGLDEREAGAKRGNDLVDPFCFVATGFSGRHFSNQDWFFLRCKEWVDVLEHLMEGLPAAVRRTPVVAVDASPIDVGVAGIVVHGSAVASGGVGDVGTPRPNHVVRASGNEEVVNVSISRNVQGGVVAAPGLVAVHLGGEVKKKLLAQCFGTFGTGDDRGIEAAIDDPGEVDVVGFPTDERNASRREVGLSDGPGPIGFPSVIGEVNDRCAAELSRRLVDAAGAVELPEQGTRRGLENG